MKTLPRWSAASIAAGLLLLWGCDHSSAVRRDGGTNARDAAVDRAGDTGDASSRADLVDGATADADGPAGRADVAPEIGPADAPLDRATDLTEDGAIVEADGGSLVVEVGDTSAGFDTSLVREDAPTNGPEVPDAPWVDRDAPGADAVVPGVDAAGKDADPNLLRVTVVPNRVLDLVFVIDNSPSMAEKQAKLAAQFPKLIQALVDPMTGALPDLRLAILDQDLGTGGAYPSGSCGPKGVPDAGASDYYGDLGRFQMIDAANCGVTVPGALWLEHRQGRALNYTGDIGSVFACLAGNLGTLGCGIEHTLQALEFALVGRGLGNEDQHALLRPDAYLGLVFVTDEDDCSAMTNTGMFGDKPELRGESASLRCSTRAHACGGANLADAPPGYPATASFIAPFQSCAARTDACPNPTDGTGTTDTSVPTACSALKSIKHMADEIKALKQRPAEQIYVAGIFGWPLDGTDLTTSRYKIAPIPNPNTADTTHPTVYDVWPICYDPNHLPSNPDPATGFDAEAAFWGGTPGLRIAAFIDEFGDHGGKHSICEPDYSGVMAKIGSALARPAGTLCAPARPDDYAGCTARYLLPDGSGFLVPSGLAMPRCAGASANAPCFVVASDTTKCAGAERVVEVVDGAGGIDGGALPPGTLLEIDCR